MKLSTYSHNLPVIKIHIGNNPDDDLHDTLNRLVALTGCPIVVMLKLMAKEHTQFGDLGAVSKRFEKFYNVEVEDDL